MGGTAKRGFQKHVSFPHYNLEIQFFNESYQCGTSTLKVSFTLVLSSTGMIR